MRTPYALLFYTFKNGLIMIKMFEVEEINTDYVKNQNNNYKCHECGIESDMHDHMFICEDCNEQFCDGCQGWCIMCSEYTINDPTHCMEHQPKCRCDEPICKECKENPYYKCSHCNEQICTHCSAYCGTCEEATCYACMGPASKKFFEVIQGWMHDHGIDNIRTDCTVYCFSCEMPLTAEDVRRQIDEIKERLSKIQLTEENEAELRHTRNMTKTYRIRRKNLLYRLTHEA